MTNIIRTTDDEGVTTITLGTEDDGVELTVLPAGEDGPLQVEIEGLGAADIADGGLRLGRELAAELAATLFELLTDR